MDETGGPQPDSTRLKRTFRKLVRHDVRRWALTGGLAIGCHDPRSPRALNDIDFVAPTFDSIPTSLAADFLFRHVHPHDPPGKHLVQFIDPETALRVDVFRACGATLLRTTHADLGFGPMAVVSMADLAARAARLSLDLAHGGPVPAKHARDYLNLVTAVSPAELAEAWADHRKPSHPTEFCEVRNMLADLIPACSDLLITPEYSKNPDEICPRCHAIAAFPLADPRAILALLGYC